MIDTIRLKSPFISEELARSLEERCMLYTCVDKSTGEQLYAFTSSNLSNTFDKRISLQVRRYDFETLKRQVSERLKVKIARVRVPSEPYIMLECSIHKQMIGHNVYGGSNDIKGMVSWLIDTLNDKLQVQLPVFTDWVVERIDYAEAFRLRSKEDCLRWFDSMTRAVYMRRKNSQAKYTDVGRVQSLYVPGSTTTVKIYYKGDEFKKHDYKGLKIIDLKRADMLQEVADKTVRCEVEVHARKMRADFGKLLTVAELDVEYLQGIYDTEIKRLLNVAGGNEMIKRQDKVKGIIFATYENELANKLYSFWLRLATDGELIVKKDYEKATFYRNKAKLKQLNISWLGSDLELTQVADIIDFTPVRTSEYKDNETDPDIISYCEGKRAVQR